MSNTRAPAPLTAALFALAGLVLLAAAWLPPLERPLIVWMRTAAAVLLLVAGLMQWRRVRRE